MAAVVRIPVPVESPLVGRPALRVVHGGRVASAGRNPYLLRRLLAVTVVVLVAVALGAAVGSLRSPVEVRAEALELQADGTYVVRPGDTLWSIAGRMTAGDPRPVVDRLVEANGGVLVHPGDRLQLP